jgi:hypothetical protein
MSTSGIWLSYGAIRPIDVGLQPGPPIGVHHSSATLGFEGSSDLLFLSFHLDKSGQLAPIKSADVADEFGGLGEVVEGRVGRVLFFECGTPPASPCVAGASRGHSARNQLSSRTGHHVFVFYQPVPSGAVAPEKTTQNIQ